MIAPCGPRRFRPRPSVPARICRLLARPFVIALVVSLAVALGVALGDRDPIHVPVLASFYPVDRVADTLGSIGVLPVPFAVGGAAVVLLDVAPNSPEPVLASDEDLNGSCPDPVFNLGEEGLLAVELGSCVTEEEGLGVALPHMSSSWKTL